MTARVVLSVLLACLGPAAAGAQDTPPPPVARGLFGSGRTEPRARFGLAFDVAHADELTAESGFDEAAPLHGWYSAVRGDLTYRTTSRRMTFGADAATAFQYYKELDRTIGQYAAAVAWGTTLGRQTALSATQSVTYMRGFRPQIVPTFPSDTGTASPVSSISDAVSQVDASASTTSLSLERGLGRRASVELSSDVRLVNFAGSDLDLRAWGAHGRITQRMTRRAALHLGYGRRVGEYGDAPQLRQERIHDVKLGVDYSRPFSARSRQLMLSFTPGLSLVGGTEGNTPRLTAETSLNHPIGRTWNARLIFNSGLQFVDGFPQPFSSDAVTAGLNGLLGRRLGLSATGGYSTGEIGSGGGSYRTYSGLAQASIAMSRDWAVSLDYSYQRYRFGAGVELPAGLLASLERHSVRAGVRWLRPL